MQTQMPLAASAQAPALPYGWRARTLATFPRLWVTLRLWRRRSRERRTLAAMDAAALADLGITSADRWQEARKPFWRQ